MSDYKQLPAAESADYEKGSSPGTLAGFTQAKSDAAAAGSYGPPQDGVQRTGSYRGAYVRAAMVTLLAALVLLLLSTLCAGGFDHPAFVHPDARARADESAQLGPQSARGLVKRAEGAAPTYSSLLTTDSVGDPTTESFVYTTRPIVNPGGYTIGTLTGYVQISSTATADASSETSQPDASSSSSAAAEDPSTGAASTPTAAPTSAPSSDSTPTSSDPQASSPSATVIAAAESTTPMSSDPATATTTSAPSTETTTSTSMPFASRLASWISEAESAAIAAETVVIRGLAPAPLLGKRDVRPLNETAEEEEEVAPMQTPPPTTTASATITGAAEYSTSTDRAKSVYTLVKTTRPIVNPGGYVIGTLDGAWVDVAKQTAAPAADASQTQRAQAVSPQQHEELRRRRNSVDFASSATA